MNLLDSAASPQQGMPAMLLAVPPIMDPVAMAELAVVVMAGTTEAVVEVTVEAVEEGEKYPSFENSMSKWAMREGSGWSVIAV
ncbi:hypothetical protein M3J09_009348 [Ascochyta lentis]